MTRTDNTHRSLFLVALVVLAAVVGTVAVTGTVGAQDAGTNGTDGNTSAANTTDESFYSPSEEDPLNVRFRDGDANTVESVAEGVLNLNIVYGMFDGSYDVEITASGLSEEQVEDITFDNAADDTNDLDRTDIVGMNFTGVPAGEYEFTVSVVGGNATETLPLEVTGEDAAAETPSNESVTNETTEEPATNETTETPTEAGNETEMGAGTDSTGNTTITAVPSAANTSTNHTVSTVVGPNGAGNLTAVTINYRESNVSIGPVLTSLRSASLGGESIINNTTTVTIGPVRQNLTINFDGTVQVSEGDRLNITYGGVTNPTEAGTYTVGVAVNNGTFDNATLSVTQNTTADNGAAQTTTATQTTTTAAQTSTQTTTTGGTAAGTAVSTAAGTGGGGGGGGQQGTEAGGPGFGIAVAVVALLAAALLAVRRN